MDLKPFCSLALGIALALCVPRAEARVEAGSDYTKAQTFSAALRFLRVDRGYEVLEKDPDAAYLLFRYPLNDRRTSNGSVEVVETADGVRLYVQLPALPEYHEAMLRDGLLKKLRDEYGTPPPKAPAKPPSETKPERTPRTSPPAGTGARPPS